MEIQQYIKERQVRVEGILRPLLRSSATPSELHSAMVYAVLNGGKRLRPVLAYASAEAVAGFHACADIPACAVELVHTYSLVHDDLPAMDNDTLRRGKPTCHVVFGEATAILAGDALQALAFELLADSNGLSVGNATRLQMITCLTQSSGWCGMVAGQSIDIDASGTSMDEGQLAHMHTLKTGGLIAASVRLGALSTGIVQKEQLASLEKFAYCIGLAFQVQDDILDVESDTQVLGKKQGQDQYLNKPTYPSMLGLDGARTRMQELYDQGVAELEGFGSAADPLIEIARYITQRSH
ncbi:polyprenyl synthetase family protein [Gammaproteobacteria bacterium]|nr:polyprenyl synthetase family protein [Gammaproteobacteria bacterium]